MEKPTLPGNCRILDFALQYKKTCKHYLYASAVDPLTLDDVINMADAQCKALWENMKLSYTDPAGNPLLLQEIAQLHQVTVHDVLVVVPREGIVIAIYCLVNHVRKEFNDDCPHVILASPTYQCLDELVKMQHCHVDYWKIKETKEGWTFDFDELKSSIRNDTRLLVLNFPHNPSGYQPSESDWNKIVQLCKERNIYLFSDDMYRFSNNDGTDPLPDACAVTDNAVSLSGLSKTFALPGLRIGWLCTRNVTLMESMKTFKIYTTMCSPGPCEILATIALRNTTTIIQRTHRIIKKNLDLLDGFFRDHEDIFEWRRPRGSTVGLMKLKGWLLDVGAGGAFGFCSSLAQEPGVLLLPSGLFGMKDDCVRVGFGIAGMEDALIALRQFLKNNKPQ